MEIDLTRDSKPEVINLEADQRNLSVDYALYAKFWQLQDYFRNPNQCYDSVKWKTFAKVCIFFLTLQVKIVQISIIFKPAQRKA